MAKKPKQPAIDMDAAQSAAGEVRATLQRAIDALGNAESCETEADLRANLSEASTEINIAAREIAEIFENQAED